MTAVAWRFIAFVRTTKLRAKPEAGKPQPLEWLDGDMPYSTAFGDHFYCREDGRAECAYVFLDGNGLPGRWAEGGEFVMANSASAPA